MFRHRMSDPQHHFSVETSKVLYPEPSVLLYNRHHPHLGVPCPAAGFPRESCGEALCRVTEVTLALL